MSPGPDCFRAAVKAVGGRLSQHEIEWLVAVCQHGAPIENMPKLARHEQLEKAALEALGAKEDS